MGHVRATWQAVSWCATCRVSFVIVAGGGRLVVPSSHLGVLSLKGIIAVVVVGGGNLSRGRTHRSTVVFPLILTKQFLLKKII